MEIAENPQALFGFASKWWRYHRQEYTEIGPFGFHAADSVDL
jgi:hypothetical protein